LTTIPSALESPRGRVPRLVVLAIVAGWAVAVAADVSGTGATLHHHGPIEGGPPLWAALLLFLVAWQAMVAAMMLPSSLPLIRLFDAASERQEHAWRVRSAFLGGYAAVWTVFGALAFLGDGAIHSGIDSLPWFAEQPWLLAGGVLALAGAFQFSGLKERCLSKCRHPAPYLLAHYRRGAAAGFRLGLGHGIFYLGCCWALMLVMFATGVATLWWMAALTVLMVYEKLGRYGTEAARVAGVALLAAAVIQFAHPAWLPRALGGPTPFRSEVQVGPGAVMRVMRMGGYQVTLHLNPNRATRSGGVRIGLRRRGEALDGARVQANLTMLDMDMPNLSRPLQRMGPGVYSTTFPAVGMAGRWGVRFEIAPAKDQPFALDIVDRVAP